MKLTRDGEKGGGGGGREVEGEGDYIPIADTVTTRMTSALRWAAIEPF